MTVVRREDGARIVRTRKTRLVLGGDLCRFLVEIGPFFIGWDK